MTLRKLFSLDIQFQPKKRRKQKEEKEINEIKKYISQIIRKKTKLKMKSIFFLQMLFKK